jgi:hypothetical protein
MKQPFWFPLGAAITVAGQTIAGTVGISPGYSATDAMPFSSIFWGLLLHLGFHPVLMR